MAENTPNPYQLCFYHTLASSGRPPGETHPYNVIKPFLLVTCTALCPEHTKHQFISQALARFTEKLACGSALCG
eukprot:scaffold251654_cov14-Tisochrysis_lutea.AAC.1